MRCVATLTERARVLCWAARSVRTAAEERRSAMPAAKAAVLERLSTVKSPDGTPLPGAVGLLELLEDLGLIGERGSLLPLSRDPTLGLSSGAADYLPSRSVGAKLEQDLSAAIRFQRLLERFLELVERVDMLHCGGERSISYEVAQLLVNLLDLRARRVAYPVDEPESVETQP